MTSTPHPDLIAEIAEFCDRQSMSKSAFGHAALGDPRLVFDLEAGRELRRRTVERVRDFMRAEAKGAAA